MQNERMSEVSSAPGHQAPGRVVLSTQSMINGKVYLPYTISIPIPSLDRVGKHVPYIKMCKFERDIATALAEQLGGSSIRASVGWYRSGDAMMYDSGQGEVISAADSIAKAQSAIDAIEPLLLQMADELNQESVFAAVYGGPSVLMHRVKS